MRDFPPHMIPLSFRTIFYVPFLYTARGRAHPRTGYLFFRTSTFELVSRADIFELHTLYLVYLFLCYNCALHSSQSRLVFIYSRLRTNQGYLARRCKIPPHMIRSLPRKPVSLLLFLTIILTYLLIKWSFIRQNCNFLSIDLFFDFLLHVIIFVIFCEPCQYFFFCNFINYHSFMKIEVILNVKL